MKRLRKILVLIVFSFSYPVYQIKKLLTRFSPSRMSYGFNEGYYKPMLGHLGEKTNIGNNLVLKHTKSLFIERDVRIGNNVVLESSGAKISIGKGSEIENFCKIKAGEIDSITIGANTYLGYNSYIDGIGGIIIGNHSMVGAHTIINTAQHLYLDSEKTIKSQGSTYKLVEIGSDVYIGTNVTILPDVTIGDGSVIGAGSLVNKDIPPYSIAIGVPCKIVAKRKS